jgi:hypothetical protein
MAISSASNYSWVANASVKGHRFPGSRRMASGSTLRHQVKRALMHFEAVYSSIKKQFNRFLRQPATINQTTPVMTIRSSDFSFDIAVGLVVYPLYRFVVIYQ